jgi:hypothetical protein
VGKQVHEEYDCNSDMMALYLAEVRRMEKFFDGFEVRFAPRLDNHDVNHLAWIASCHTPFRERGNEASIRVPRMFKSHAWQQLINRCNVINKRVIFLT